MAIFLGCDPGAKGAICLLDPHKGTAKFGPTPGGNTPSGVIFEALIGDHLNLVVRAAIEDVHSLYGMSAKSNFSFGWNCGSAGTLLECVLRPYDVDLEKVQPKVWQKAVGITVKGKAIKKAVADLAHQFYPNAKIYGPQGGLLDGRADALMIAHYLSLQE